MRDVGLLVLRLTVGSFLAGHGAQKLFGWFGGPGLRGADEQAEKLGMRPGQLWGPMNALGEFMGGVLSALGFLNPLGPISIAADMAVAIRRVHLHKPIWSMQGGAEFPLTNLAAALALAFGGPGRYSLDRLLGVRLPRWLVGLATVSMIGVSVGAAFRPEVAEPVMQEMNQLLHPSTPAPEGRGEPHRPETTEASPPPSEETTSNSG